MENFIRAHNCSTLMKSGNRSGSVCNATAFVYDPFKKAWCCRRHNKMSEEQTRRCRSEVLCNFEPGKPDPVGELNIESLGGYINVYAGAPVFRQTIPLVYMAHLESRGVLDRQAVVDGLMDSLQYMLSRPDIYERAPGYVNVDICDVQIKSISWVAHLQRFIASICVIE